MTPRSAMPRNRIVLHLTGFCLLVVLPLSSAWAQTVTGSITGQVTDPSGALVSGATVIAENVATSVQTTATTNSAGLYTIRFPPIGTYKITVQAKGFNSANVPAFTLEIDQTAKIDVALTIGSTTTIVVQAEDNPLPNTTNSHLGTQ